MRKAVSLMLLTGFLVSMVGCGATSEHTVTIASLSPLSKGNVANGEAIRDGVKMAIEEHGKALENLGYHINFKALDDQGDPKVGPVTAVRAVKEDDSLLAIVGTYNSGTAIPASEAIQPYDVVMVSPANTAVKVTERGLSNIDRIVARDDLQGLAAARFIKYTLRASSLFVVSDQTTYGVGIADEVAAEARRLGLTVLEVKRIQTVDQSDTSIRDVVAAMGQMKPGAVFYGGEYPEASVLVRFMREKKIDSAFISDDGIDSSEFSRRAGPAADGVYYTTVAGPVDRTSEGREWAERYQRLYGRPPEAFSAYGYDAAQVVLRALSDFGRKNGGLRPTRKELAKLVRQTSGMVGVASQVTFDHKGDNRDAKVYLFRYDLKQQQYPGILLGEG